jgi:hypothetical protein
MDCNQTTPTPEMGLTAIAPPLEGERVTRSEIHHAKLEAFKRFAAHWWDVMDPKIRQKTIGGVTDESSDTDCEQIRLRLNEALMYCLLRLLVIFAANIAVVWSATASSRFDCARPFLKVDYVICASAAAQNANDELTDAWRRLNELLDPAEGREVLADQRQWIRTYGGLCNVPGNGRPTKGQIERATQCVIGEIRGRVFVINSIANKAAAAKQKQSQPNLSEDRAAPVLSEDRAAQPSESLISNSLTENSTSNSYIAFLRSIFPIIMMIGIVAVYAYLIRIRSLNILQSAGIRKHLVPAFSSKFTNVEQQRLISSKMSDEELLWSIFLPEHQDTAKRVVAEELTRRGISSDRFSQWVPSGFRLPTPTSAYRSMETFEATIARRLLFYFAIRVVSILATVCLIVGATMGSDVPDQMNENIPKLEAYFSNPVLAYIYYGLFHSYMIFFFVSLIGCLAIFPLFVGQSFRIVLLRPFGEKSLTRSLKRFLLLEMAGRGNIITLSDKNFKPNIIVAGLGKIGWPFIFLVNPIFRGSRRIGRVKNDKTFYKLAKFIISPIGIRVSNGISCGQAFNIQCKDSWWKCCVSLLLDTSDIVLVDLSKVKHGTEWEIEEIVKRNIVDRCLFVVAQDWAESAREVMERYFGSAATGIAIYLYDHNGMPCDQSGFRRRLRGVLCERLKGAKDVNLAAVSGRTDLIRAQQTVSTAN